MWDNSLFDDAFDHIGLRLRVIRLIDGQPASEFMARFDRPQVIDMGDLIHTTDYSIEYTTSDVLPELKYDEELSIEVKPDVYERYRVNQETLAQGDGYWTRATLSRA